MDYKKYGLFYSKALIFRDFIAFLIILTIKSTVYLGESISGVNLADLKLLLVYVLTVILSFLRDFFIYYLFEWQY